MESAQQCGHRCCKFSSVVFLVIGSTLIIAGSVVIAKSKDMDFFDSDFDEYVSNQSKRHGGIAMLVIGIMFLIPGLITAGCSYCLKTQKPYNPETIPSGQGPGPAAYPTQPMGYGTPNQPQPYPGTYPVQQQQQPGIASSYPQQPTLPYPVNQPMAPYPGVQMLPSYDETMKAMPGLQQTMPAPLDANYPRQDGPSAPPANENGNSLNKM